MLCDRGIVSGMNRHPASEGLAAKPRVPLATLFDAINTLETTWPHFPAPCQPVPPLWCMRKTKRSQDDNEYKVTPAKRMRPININDQGRS